VAKNQRSPEVKFILYVGFSPGALAGTAITG
jgi:hypothetical protein